MAEPRHVWMVRAGDDNELADTVWNEHAVAIGWPDIGDLSKVATREALKGLYRETFSDDPARRVDINAGQLYRFAWALKEGDYVLTYNKSTRDILIGVCEGPYEYRPDVLSERYPNVRRVRWLKRVSRDDFSAPARNSFGSSLTVFQADAHLEEIQLAISAAESPMTSLTGGDEPSFYDETQSKAEELIADLISKLAPYDFQDLVAGVLRAMGFRATSARPGPDGGVDIVAHPDAFGFEGPRIKVQVKHKKERATGPEMQQLRGALHDGSNGLFVSTSGFTEDARSQAGPMKILDRDEFIKLMLEHYEALEPEFKAQVPLKKVWVPAG